MPDFDRVERDHVLRTLEEYDERGADEFLERYGFGRARSYVLRHDGRDYDSKAVLGAAHGHATGTPASSSDFSGGKDGAAKVLRALGFQVTEDGTTMSETDTDAATGTDEADVETDVETNVETNVETKTTEADAAPEVGSEAARVAWADAAREVLVAAAQRYQSVVTSKDLAREVQERSGVHSTRAPHYWIGEVLTRVAVDCDRRGEPSLASLCVNASGSVGAAYGTAVHAVTGTTPDDPDAHAAKERLACHRHFEAPDLPKDGGFAALVPTLQRSRDRARKARLADAPIAMCPHCNMALPKTGVCDNCD